MAEILLMRSLESLEQTINERMVDLSLAESEVAALRRRIIHLLVAAGEPGKCPGPRCRANVIFIRHLNGRKVPYDLDGAIHCNSCPDAPTTRR